MKLFYAILFLVIPFVGVAQTDTTFITYDRNIHDDTLIYETDTVINEGIFGREILAGTTVLPMSRNNIGAMAHGFTLTKIDFAPCKNRGREIVRLRDTEVISVFKTDTSWTADLKVIDNCCYDFLCEINIKNDSILDFIYTGYGDHCGCNCCFGLVYEIKLEDYSKDDIAKVTHTMLNGRKSTIKKIE